ncbi:hypothetical protein [Hyphobacterium marinum]|uniref:Uncharacterized protein n=1 Tax=Hyphobacterium marinum TaxID=3116574 RepID=A0ABU7LUP5_9PROT|nr:hypothetical protein [Hyphobacterium sp. Y6023]MEE2565274.1 hypothetical protein [Hyphobacterium sp. Y6023]
MTIRSAFAVLLLSASALAQEVVPVGPPATLFVLEDPIEFHGERFDFPVYLLTDPVEFHGDRFDFPTYLLTDPVAFHGAPELDLARLRDMQAEVARLDGLLENWYTQHSMSVSLTGSELAPEDAQTPEFRSWLRGYVGAAFWDYSQESNVRSFFWGHHEALQAAIDELDRSRDPEGLRRAIDYFDRGMERWRELRATFDGFYFDCYLNGMLETRGLFETYDALDWNDDRRDPAYETFRATQRYSNACVSAEALANLTETPAFTWPPN